ncbi:MAG: hypothetical protein RLZZ214_3634 [Verrucomicrobiota bacterium]
MNIDLIAWGDSIGGLSLKSAGKQSKVTAHRFSYSTPVSYFGPVIMEIHQSGSGSGASKNKISTEDKDHELSPLIVEDAETNDANQGQAKQGLALELEKRRKESPSLVALAALPGPSCRRATVLLAPADAGTFTAYVIDDDPSKLPLGQLRIHNLSPLTIAMRCNGQVNKELKTRDTLLVPGQNGQLIYELAYKLGEEWKMQEDNIMPIRPTEQAQMLILKSGNSFFASTDGSTGGFLQIATLRRNPAQQAAAEAAKKTTQ